MKKSEHDSYNKRMDYWFNRMGAKKYLRYCHWFGALLLLSIACSATQEIAPTFIPATPTPYPSETPLPPPTSTPFPNPTDLTANMAPPTPTNSPLGVAALGAGCIPSNELKALTVVRVLTGDTIVVDIDQISVELLYIGIAAPKLDGQIGQGSKAQNDAWVNGKTITVIHDQNPINGFGQLEGYVLADEIFINYEMVRLGLARAIISKTNSSCNETFRQGEEEARRAKVGLWSDSNTDPAAPQPQETNIP